MEQLALHLRREHFHVDGTRRGQNEIDQQFIQRQHLHQPTNLAILLWTDFILDWNQLFYFPRKPDRVRLLYGLRQYLFDGELRQFLRRDGLVLH